MSAPKFRSLLVVLLFTCAAALVASSARAASTFAIVNLDGPGEGLNDSSPVSPIGGNTGTTLGEARQRAVDFAAALLANVLESDVPIRVGVQFDPLEGSPDAGVLGLGGPASAFRDFTGAPRAGTWYPSALADRLAGVDLAPSDLDVVVTFNSDTDGDVFLGTTHFYYGFVAAPLGDDVDFVSIALHEMVHGLGFQTFLDVTTGEKLFGYDDHYLLHLEHHGAAPADFASMTDAQRLDAITAGTALHWTGASVVVAGSGLAGGVGAGGHVEMHSPSPAKPRSSLSHFSTAVFPDDVLEPFYVEPSTRLALTRAVLEDVGWGSPQQCIDASSP
jgi:hypothetical protein